MFSVTCLGRNGLYPTVKSPTSGYLVECDDTKILIDVGSGVFASLLDIMPPEDLTAVIVSHFHGDHSSDLCVFNYYLATKNKKLRVYAPEPGKEALKPFPTFTFEEMNDGESVAIDGVVIKFFRTAHPVPCLGVRVTYDGKTLVYSADTNVSENLGRAMAGADLAILDCAFSKDDYKPNGPHLSSILCAEYAKKYNVKTLLSHLPPQGDINKILCEAAQVTPLCELIELKKYHLSK